MDATALTCSRGVVLVRRTACFNRRTCLRWPWDSRLDLVLLVLFAIVVYGVRSFDRAAGGCLFMRRARHCASNRPTGHDFDYAHEDPDK